MKKVLDFPSKIENISIVENLVDELSEKFELDSVIYGNILVSVVESVSNAILHGNKSDINKKVFVECSVDKNVVLFKVRDEGTGFDYSKIPDPTLPENLDKPHGRGIFLMSRLADKIKFEKEGREVEIMFKIAS